MRLTVLLPEGELGFPKAAPLDIRPKRARCLWLNLALGGARMTYYTSEITPGNADRRTLALRGEFGTEGEIAFGQDLRVSLDGEALLLRQHDGASLATYAHASTPRTLSVGDTM